MVSYIFLQSYSLEPISSGHADLSNIANGGLHIEDEVEKIEPQNMRNIRLWYEDTKLWENIKRILKRTEIYKHTRF
jgi:hypothetical protein